MPLKAFYPTRLSVGCIQGRGRRARNFRPLSRRRSRTAPKQAREPRPRGGKRAEHGKLNAPITTGWQRDSRSLPGKVSVI